MAGRKPGSKKSRKEAREAPPLSCPWDAADGRNGRVIAHHGVAVLVRFESGEEEQVWLAPDQKAVVGDLVSVSGLKLYVQPAYGMLRRLDARGRERTIATNLDRLGIVIAPEPREPPGYIDRGIVIARAAGISPFVVLNKSDLDAGDTLLSRLREIYCPEIEVISVSAELRQGLPGLAEFLPAGSLGALVGPSGVGKSSPLNALVPDLELRVSELNRGSGKGRHTTTTATLHMLEGGGALVDTAGFKDFIALDLEPMLAAEHFPGFEKARDLPEPNCRFRDCLHRTEPDCAILTAVAEGLISERRHGAYLQLVEELELTSAGRS